MRQQGISTADFYSLLRDELEKEGAKSSGSKGYEYKGTKKSKEEGAKQVRNFY